MTTLDKHSIEPQHLKNPAPTGHTGLRARLTDASSRDGVARALFVLAATLSFGFSVVLYFSGDQQAGIFVGIWVPSILALGALLVPRRAADHEGR